MTQEPSIAKRAGMIAAGAGLVGVLLPWVQASVLTRSGIDTGDGKVVAALAVAALVAGLFKLRARRLGVTYLICGGIALAATLHDLLQIIRMARPTLLSGAISAGAGLYVDTAAFLALVIAGLALIVRGK